MRKARFCNKLHRVRSKSTDWKAIENSLLTSLDVDQSTSNIYYTTQDSVKVFSPKDSTKRSLITGLSQPDDKSKSKDWKAI
jgi:hypothetical protein